MAGVIGTPHNGGYSASASLHVITTPPGIQAGELSCIAYLVSENNRVPVIAGYTNASLVVTVDSSWTAGILYKVAGGSEPATEMMTFSPVGSSGVSYVSFRMQGYDTANFLNSNPGAVDQPATATATPSIAASTLSMTSGNSCLVIMGCEANRSVTAADADLDTVVGNIASTNSAHFYLDSEVIGTGNPQYDFTINSSRRMGTALFELKVAAPAGPTVLTIADPASDSMTITLSEAAATVDTISITYGGVTQSQSYTTGDDTTFTIASLTRNLLPPTGTVTVTLLAGATEITSTTTVLDDIAGWETTDLVSPVTTEGSVFYNHTGATPVTGDKVRHNDPGNTTISATGILTQTTPRTVTVEAWDDSDGTYGSLGTFTYSAGGGLSIIKSGIITQGLITSGLIQ